MMLLALFSPLSAWALRPMYHSIALVAGCAIPGCHDGSFTSAQFNKPLGLTINPEGTLLFVADTGNNRIRVIHLEQDNIVTTLTGGDKPGSLNGPLQSAAFNQPRGILYLPGERLVVNDFGNQLLRLVDLKKGVVTTLAGGPTANLKQGPVTQVPMDGVRDMTYLPEADSLFLTQPGRQTIKRLDLKTGQITNVLANSEIVPVPVALCGSGGKLYLADSSRVFLLDWKTGMASSPALLATPGTQIQALAENGDHLYALLSNAQTPLMRVYPQVEPVTFTTVSGDVMPEPGKNLLSFTNPYPDDPVHFIADPRDPRKFFAVNPYMNIVTSFRDLFETAGWYGGINSNGLSDFEYPSKKPPHTFRILFCGDSRSCAVLNYPFKTTWNIQTWNGQNGSGTNIPPRQLSLSKQLELQLNTLAALEDLPDNFEVLNLYHNSNNPSLLFWPAFEVPNVVKKNDIDLVVLFETPPTGGMDYIPFLQYFFHTLTPEGLPSTLIDPEYLLKPPTERIPNGDPRTFYDLCKAKKYVQIAGNNFGFDPGLFKDPAIHESLVRLYGRPLQFLSQKLSAIIVSSGKSARLLICYTHTGPFASSTATFEDPQIWPDVAKGLGIPYIDLNDEMTALSLSYFPLTENEGNQHFNPSGHLFFGRLLAHDLLRGGFIPKSDSSASH